MIRAFVKLVLVVVVVAVVAAFFLGYRFADNGVEAPVSAIQTTPGIDTQKARETGAKIGETVATGAAKAEQALSEGALTTKIKSKMALDDTVKALSIDVDTKGTVVTLSGRREFRSRTHQSGATRPRNRRRDRGRQSARRPLAQRQIPTAEPAHEMPWASPSLVNRPTDK